MRGSVFYSDNRLHVRECDINYNFHREMLKKIKTRQKSTLSKSTRSKLNSNSSRSGIPRHWNETEIQFQ